MDENLNQNPEDFDAQGMNYYIENNVKSTNFSDLNYNDETTSYEMPPQKSKPGKAGKIVLISVIAVVVVAVITVAAYFIFRKTPEEIIKAAVAMEDGGDFEGTIVVNDLSGTYDMTDMTISVDGIACTGEDGRTDTEFDLSFERNGETLSIYFASIDDMTYYAVPELYDDVFVINSESLLEDDDYANAEDTERINELYEEYLEPAVDEFKDAIIYEKVGSTEITDYNGDDIKCKQYTMTVTSEAVRALLDAGVDFGVAYADEFLDDEYFDEAEMTREEFASMLEMVPTYCNMIFTRDIVVNFYINDEELVRIDAEYKFIALDITANVYADFKGEGEPFSFGINLTNDEETLLDLSGEFKCGNLGKEISGPDPLANIVNYEDVTDEYLISNINTDNLTSISEAFEIDLATLLGIDTGLSLDDFELSEEEQEIIEKIEEYEIDLSDDSAEEIEIDYDEYFGNSEDYSEYNLVSDNYTVSIIEPDGYERCYADDYEIDVEKETDDDDIYYVYYYSIIEDCDIEAECEAFLSYAEYYGEDYVVSDSGLSEVTLSDGSTISVYVINATMDEYQITDYYYFYPLSDSDYVIAEANIWLYDGETVDKTEAAEEMVNSDVISVQ